MMKKQQPLAHPFALCLNNQDYPASLQVGKVYRVIPDAAAATHGYIRVVDESGEDYAFSAERFHLIPLPRKVEHLLLAASEKIAA